jgi:hypothetical protein
MKRAIAGLKLAGGGVLGVGGVVLGVLGWAAWAAALADRWGPVVDSWFGTWREDFIAWAPDWANKWDILHEMLFTIPIVVVVTIPSQLAEVLCIAAPRIITGKALPSLFFQNDDVDESRSPGPLATLIIGAGTLLISLVVIGFMQRSRWL